MNESPSFPDPVHFQPDMAKQFIGEFSKRSGVELPYVDADADLVVGALLGEYLESDEATGEKGQAYAEFAIGLLQQPQNRRSADSRRMLARRVIGEESRYRWENDGVDESAIESMLGSDNYQKDLERESSRFHKNAIASIHSVLAERLSKESQETDRNTHEASLEELRVTFHNSVIDLLEADHITKTEAASLLLIMENVPFSQHRRLRFHQRKAVGEMRAKLAYMRDRDNPVHVILDDLAQVKDDEAASFDQAVARHMKRTKLSYEAAAKDFLTQSTNVIVTILSRGE